MLPAKGIVPIRRNRRERSHAAHGRLGALRGSMSMKRTMRRMRPFSAVSSNWDDSFCTKHLPS